MTSAGEAGVEQAGNSVVEDRVQLDVASPAHSSNKNHERRAERTLWVMLSVSTVLTITQIICGWIGNSLSLLGDGALMAMDAVSYCVSLCVERRKGAVADHARADRFGAFVSLILLAAATSWMLFDAIDRLLLDDDPDTPGFQREEVDVSGAIMIIFTVVNLLGDALIIYVVWKCNGDAVLGKDENMNLYGAFMHLAADIVRGFAVLVCGILAVTGTVDAMLSDAVCSLFVCLFVLSAAFSLLWDLLKKANPTAYVQFDDAGKEIPCAPSGASAQSEQANGEETVAVATDPLSPKPVDDESFLRRTAEDFSATGSQSLAASSSPSVVRAPPPDIVGVARNP